MKTVTAEKPRANLDQLLQETAASHEPIHITGGSSTGVLISEEGWRSIQETLYLLGVNVQKTIHKALQKTYSIP